MSEIVFVKKVRRSPLCRLYVLVSCSSKGELACGAVFRDQSASSRVIDVEAELQQNAAFLQVWAAP